MRKFILLSLIFSISPIVSITAQPEFYFSEERFGLEIISSPYSITSNSYCPMCDTEGYNSSVGCKECGHGISHPSVGTGENSAPIIDDIFIMTLFNFAYLFMRYSLNTKRK